MSLCAGFAEVDITPPIGTNKIGWLKVLVGQEIRDPLYARVAVLATATERIAVIQADTLFVAWPEVAAIRENVATSYGFPPYNVMVAATHNHAGPAVAHAGDVPKDAAYAQELVAKVTQAFGRALENLGEVEIGFGSVFEWNVAHNRRVVMRDGTVRTHGTFDDPNALYLEGPIDPEVAVIAVRDKAGELSGVLVNFACHPTHHGGDTVFSAGFPGDLAARVRSRFAPAESDRGPVVLFLNGASGNLHTSDPRRGGANLTLEEAGQILAKDVCHAIEGMQLRDRAQLGATSRTLELPYRRVTDAEIQGQARGAQRFVDPAIYDRAIPPLLSKIRERGTHRAEIQALLIDEYALLGVPGEYFCEFGLQIKERAYPARPLVVTCANGRLGYIPTPAAFARGGYETTFGPSSMLASEAGDLIAEAAVELVAQHNSSVEAKK